MEEQVTELQAEQQPDIEADFAKALKALQAKQPMMKRYYDAYDGKLPLPWISDRLKAIFEGNLTTDDLRENYAGVVIDACADKITLTGFTLKNAQHQAEIEAIIADTELLLEADDAHKHALIAGQSFIVAWRDDEQAPLDVYYHKGHQCHIVPEAERPNITRCAVKWWCDDEDDHGRSHIYIRQYYPHIAYCWRTTERVAGLGDTKPESYDLVPDMQAVNPFGVVPVFAFQPDRREIVSDLRDVIPAQNPIGMLSINEIVAGEFNAFRQKYIISNADNLGALQTAPGAMWLFSAGDGEGQDTELGEFSETPLDNYGKAITRRIEGIAAMTRTPIHYFFKSGSVPSGEALIALEAPLNKKAQDRIDRFSVVWRKLVVFLLALKGIHDAQPEDVTPLFDKPETVQPRTQAEIVKMNVEAGIPLGATMRQNGYDEATVVKVEAEVAANERAALTQAMRQFNAGAFNQEGDNGQGAPNTTTAREAVQLQPSAD